MTHGTGRDWVTVNHESGAVTGYHLASPSHWAVEEQEDGNYRLTVHPDPATYGWLSFRTRKEALTWVKRALRKKARGNGHIEKEIISWLHDVSSNS